MKRPLIPKRLAARIRACQERVKQKRLSIVYGDEIAATSARRLAEFDSEPESFASRYYGHHGVDSYPVQTTIGRERERLEYNEGRKAGRIAELVEAERELARTEAEIQAEVEGMRSTIGRVPWPRGLPSFKH